MAVYLSGEPNFVVRYSVRLMPSRGTQGLRKYGWNRTSTGRSGRSATAFSSRRLPMKHHGQTTSDMTSIVRGSEVFDILGSFGRSPKDRRVATGPQPRAARTHGRAGIRPCRPA